MTFLMSRTLLQRLCVLTYDLHRYRNKMEKICAQITVQKW